MSVASGWLQVSKLKWWLPDHVILLGQLLRIHAPGRNTSQRNRLWRRNNVHLGHDRCRIRNERHHPRHDPVRHRDVRIAHLRPGHFPGMGGVKLAGEPDLRGRSLKFILSWLPIFYTRFLLSSQYYCVISKHSLCTTHRGWPQCLLNQVAHYRTRTLS